MGETHLLHSAFERQATSTPDRVAVAAGDRSLTYRELDRGSHALCRELLAAGAGPGRIVGVHASRSPARVIALLAVLRAGAAFLPVDPEDPPRRNALVLADAQPLLVLLDDDASSPAVPGGIRTLALDARLHGGGTAAASPLGAAASDPDELAYVIYTSGSSGRPKGVMCTHRAIANRLRWMQRRYRLNDGDRVLHKTSIGFDVAIWELFWPLSTGARLVLAPPGEQAQPEALAATIRAQQVTVAHFVPAMLAGYIRAGQLERSPTLRAVISSGEALTGSLRDAFHARSDARLHNLYGPTEASIDVTHHTCRAQEAATMVPIGAAIDNVEVLVRDARLQPVPPGEAGEICIAGTALARGYLAQPALTAERFVPHPGGGGARIYRSGDRGRVRPDGALEFLGRADRQHKLNGVRIELGEVEAALLEASGAAACCVLLDGGHDPPRLLAYLVGASSPPRRVRERLVARLPRAALPARILYRERLPTAPSGKLDRAALERPRDLTGETADSHPADGASGDRTGAERTLARIWRDVLGLAQVSPHGNFFTLGGDSIRSIEVVARAREAGLQLTTADVFAHQTLLELAQRASPAAPMPAPAPQDGPFALVDERDRRRLPSEVSDALPLSSLLAGLVAESLGSPDYLLYTTTLSVEGIYDAGALRGALAELLARHPSLRSAIALEGFGEPLQLVYREPSVEIGEIDAHGLTGSAWRGALADWLARERRARLDWGRAPLLRVTVHRRTSTLWQLTLSEPCLDGWSVTLAVVELLELYRARLRRERPRLAAAPQHCNRAALLAERGALRSREHQVFWKTYLARGPVTRLPRLGADGERRASAQQRVAVALPESVARGLAQTARALGVPLKSLLLAAHAWALGALTGQEEVLIGLMVNNRPEGADGTRAVGLFLNTVPLRLSLLPGSWAQLAHAARSAEAEVLNWRHYPYRQILADNARLRPFDSVVNFTHFRPYRDLLAGAGAPELRLRAVRGMDQTYFPLTAQFGLDPAGVRVQALLEVNPDRFARLQLRQWVDLHRKALIAMHVASAAAHHQARLIGPREQRQRHRRRAPLTLLPTPACIQELFHRQAERAPQALAVFDDRERLTYGALAGDARRLAHVLCAKCGGAPQRIAVCALRSPLLVRAVLGALDAGAAFVPLDPTLPGERLRTILADAAPQAVLVDAAGAAALAHAHAGDKGLAVPLLPAAAAAGADADAPALLPAVDPQAAAHVIYTSGSTGRPRGVVTSHAAVVNRLRWMWSRHPFHRGEVLCARTPIGFVDSVAELFGGLLRGVPTYYPAADLHEPAGLARALRAAGVTRLTLVPALLRELLRGCDAEHRALLAHIEHWVLSGEPLSGGLVAELRALAPRATVLNLYGSSEVAGDVTAHVCGAHEPDLVPAGTAIGGVTVRVLDTHARDAPCGAVGEIAVEGAALASGYLGDPRASAERFRPSPAGAGRRLFRTGDLGRFTAQGALQVLGRRDRQLKINGVRVEPAEIEAALLAHPAVRVCAVLAAPKAPGGGPPRLVAHVEVDGAPVDDAELRTHLRARLPSAMVPGAIVLGGPLPRTASGKLDLRRLAAAEPAPRASGGRSSLSAVQRAIAELTAAELGLADLRLEDDLFARGADSLAAIRLLGRLRERFGVQLALWEIFENPALGDLCARVERAIGERDGAPA